MRDWMLEHVADSYEFPTDLTDETGGIGAMRWTASVIAMTAGLLALLNAQSIRGWTEELTPGPTTIRLVAAASGWDEITAQAGLGTPRAKLHRAWRGIEEARWVPRAGATQEARR